MIAAVKQDISALVAIAERLPNCHVSITRHARGGFSVTLGCRTDADAHVAAECLAIELSPTGNDTHEWIRGEADVDGTSVIVYGEHREREVRFLDPRHSDSLVEEPYDINTLGVNGVGTEADR